MHSITLRVERPYNLELTLRPSFVSSLFERENSCWTKTRGLDIGFKVRQLDNGNLKCSVPDDMDARRIRLILGLWTPPFEHRVRTIRDGRCREILNALAKVYQGVRLPVAPWDFSWLLLAIILSRRADYERMVLRWCARVAELVGNNPWRLLRIEPEILTRAVGRSYQVIEAIEILRRVKKLVLEEGLAEDHDEDLLEAARRLPSMGSWRLRQFLLRCKGIGPKIADSIVMVTCKDTSFAPADTHLVVVSRRLGIAAGKVMPDKKYCIEYRCRECPIREECIRGYVYLKLGEFAGWYQTLTYLHGRFICHKLRPRCEECVLQALCEEGSE